MTRNLDRLLHEFLGWAASNWNKVIPPNTIDIWVDGLADLPLWKVEAALRCVTRERFMPNLGDVIAIAEAVAPSPEQLEGARRKLLSRIDWAPKELPSAVDLSRFLPDPEPLRREPLPLLGAGMTEQEWVEYLHGLKEQFLDQTMRGNRYEI